MSIKSMFFGHGDDIANAAEHEQSIDLVSEVGTTSKFHVEFTGSKFGENDPLREVDMEQSSKNNQGTVYKATLANGQEYFGEQVYTSDNKWKTTWYLDEDLGTKAGPHRQKELTEVHKKVFSSTGEGGFQGSNKMIEQQRKLRGQSGPSA